MAEPTETHNATAPIGPWLPLRLHRGGDPCTLRTTAEVLLAMLPD